LCPPRYGGFCCTPHFCTSALRTAVTSPLHRYRAPPPRALPDGVVSAPAQPALLDRWIPLEAPTPFPLPSMLYCLPPLPHTTNAALRASVDGLGIINDHSPFPLSTKRATGAFPSCYPTHGHRFISPFHIGAHTRYFIYEGLRAEVHCSTTYLIAYAEACAFERAGATTDDVPPDELCRIV
jgi:hypothetical protein